MEAFCEVFGGASEVIHFSDGPLTALEWVERLLAARAPAVPDQAIAQPELPATSFAQGDVAGDRTDPISVLLHRRAVTLMEQEPSLSYAAALLTAARNVTPYRAHNVRQ